MGQVFDESMGDQVSITLLAAGMDSQPNSFSDREVFLKADEPETPGEEQLQARSEDLPSLEPITFDEIDFDIPAFLRSQRSR